MSLCCFGQSQCCKHNCCIWLGTAAQPHVTEIHLNCELKVFAVMQGANMRVNACWQIETTAPVACLYSEIVETRLTLTWQVAFLASSAAIFIMKPPRVSKSVFLFILVRVNGLSGSLPVLLLFFLLLYQTCRQRIRHLRQNGLSCCQGDCATRRDVTTHRNFTISPEGVAKVFVGFCLTLQNPKTAHSLFDQNTR